MSFIAAVTFTVLGLLVLPRLTLTILAFILHPAFGLIVGLVMFATLFAD
jgi:hypothetical protein